MTHVTKTTRILIADDHVLFRDGLRSLLQDERRLEVVGEAADGDEAVERARELKPDVILMDLSMPGSSGLDAIRRLAALGLDARILVLTMHAEDEYLLPTIEAGASGYLTKTSADKDLVEAIRVVSRGEVYLPPTATTLLLKKYRSRDDDDASVGLGKLSSREKEVLALTAEGFSSSEIGKKLFLSPKTVDTYRARVMEKLGLKHRSELVRFALRSGLLKEV